MVSKQQPLPLAAYAPIRPLFDTPPPRGAVPREVLPRPRHPWRLAGIWLGVTALLVLSSASWAGAGLFLVFSVVAALIYGAVTAYKCRSMRALLRDGEMTIGRVLVASERIVGTGTTKNLVQSLVFAYRLSNDTYFEAEAKIVVGATVVAVEHAEGALCAVVHHEEQAALFVPPRELVPCTPTETDPFDDEFETGGALEPRVSDKSRIYPRWSRLLIFLAPLVGSFCAIPLMSGQIWWLVVPAVLFVVGAVPIACLRHVQTREVLVGTDGISLAGRFISWSDVDTAQRGGLLLRNGRAIHWYGEHEHAMAEGVRAELARYRERRAPGLPGTLPRPQLEAAQWVRALRAVVAGAAGATMRRAPVSWTDLVEVLDNPRAPAWSRAAAAVALSTANEGAESLEQAAAATVDPSLGHLLELARDGAGERELATALTPFTEVRQPR